MANQEIERKFLIKKLPENLDSYENFSIQQGYLCRKPVVRVRRAGDEYYLTYKGGGKMIRDEYNLPLDAQSYQHLLAKADGQLISKRRYRIPYGEYTIELDHFSEPRNGLYMAEVEFESRQEALSFVPPDWFGEEVTENPDYHNSNM